MSYLVFARKFRPQQFDDLLGQAPVITTLRHAIEQSRIGQAYLFAGPRGTGKTSTARLFAKALNCEQGPTPTPCNRCSTCVEITEGRSLDVMEIDGASNRTIDDIRTLRENVKFAPAKGRFKVYIIDEFHQITHDAFNALLKTLEEPPAHVKFIFATTAPHKVPATILSRCQRYEFKRIPQTIILEKLAAIAKAEQVTVPPEALALIARAAAGSLRDAESLLDQLAAFGEGTIQAADVQQLLGVVEDDVLAQAVEAILQRQPVPLLQIVAQWTEAGRDLTQFLTGLIGYLRNLMVARLGETGRPLLSATPEGWARLTTQAQAFSEEELTYLFYLLVGTYDVMRRVGDARTPLEVTLIRASRREPIAKIGDLIRQLESAPQRTPAPVRAPAPAPTPHLAPVPQKGSDPLTPQGGRTPSAAAPSAPETTTTATLEPSVTLEEIQRQWPQVLQAVQSRKMSTAAYLLEAQPVRLATGRLTLGFPPAFRFHQEALDRPEHRTLIEEALRQATGWIGRLEIVVVDGLSRPETPPTLGPDPTESVPDGDIPPPAEALEAQAETAAPPIIRAAAELFGGRPRAAAGPRR